MSVMGIRCECEYVPRVEMPHCKRWLERERSPRWSRTSQPLSVIPGTTSENALRSLLVMPSREDEALESRARRKWVYRGYQNKHAPSVIRLSGATKEGGDGRECNKEIKGRNIYRMSEVLEGCRLSLEDLFKVVLGLISEGLVGKDQRHEEAAANRLFQGVDELGGGLVIAGVHRLEREREVG